MNFPRAILTSVLSAILLTACASSPRTVVKTDLAPAAIGPYSQAIQAGEFLYVSGVIPISLDGKQVVGANIEDQTRLVLKYLEATLKSSGLTMSDVVMAHVYLIDLNEFPTVNRIYGEYFSQEPPARATVQVARLPRDVRVEIAVIAYRKRLA